MLKWKENLSIGVADIDDQHMEIFRRINSLLSAMKDGRGENELAKVTAFLEEYVETHFAAEEELMNKIDYPDTELHVAMHNTFKEEMHDIIDEIKTNGVNKALVIKTNSRLGLWWIDHINKVDKKIGVYNNKQ